MKIILQKYIAESGYCSRRKAEALIEKSIRAHNNAPVLVNGKIPEPGMKIDEHDEIKIFGKILRLPEKKIYIKLNKPWGYVSTSRQFKGEKNVLSLLPKQFHNLIIAGRLDKDSRGLMLLTNDGNLAARLTHPRYEHIKVYEVKIESHKFNKIENLIKRLKGKVHIGEGDGAVRVKRFKYLGNNKFEIVLSEGKKRQIRRMFQALGYEVKDLARVKIGNLDLGTLRPGEWRELTNKEIVKLLHC